MIIPHFIHLKSTSDIIFKLFILFITEIQIFIKGLDIYINSNNGFQK
ncbi:hypothetical protein CLOL250_00194 [Clostridium sp. L2-50]|nr:hypothetical protein CLOL250_00194 [Clostridium sp. L2-50]